MMHATCHTPTCENQGVPIPVPEDPGDVACGSCGQPITDLTDTPPALPTEVPTWLD